jgi:hypothetical protein
MTINPRAVEALFLKAADYHDAADRAAIPDRDCSPDLWLRPRVEALSRANDQFKSILNEPLHDAAERSPQNPLRKG